MRLYIFLSGCNSGNLILDDCDPRTDLECRDPIDDTETDTDVDADADADMDADTDADSDTDLDPIVIVSIDPPYGTTAGGSNVDIMAAPLDGLPEIYFGSEKAEILSLKDNKILIETPPQTSAGVVDVQITTPSGYGSELEAFTYWEDGTGLTGVLGGVEWFEYDSGFTAEPYGMAWLVFTEVADLGSPFQRYSDSIDSCTNWGSGDREFPDFVVFDVNDSSMELRSASSGNSISLSETSKWYSSGKLDKMDTATYYTLRGVDGNLPSFMINKFVWIPGDFSVRKESTSVRSDDFVLEWDTDDTEGDYVVAILYLYDDTSMSNLLETMTCTMADDGRFQVPNTWKSWRSSELLLIYYGDAKESTAVLPHNNADVNMLGINWFVSYRLPK